MGGCATRADLRLLSCVWLHTLVHITGENIQSVSNTQVILSACLATKLTPYSHHSNRTAIVEMGKLEWTLTNSRNDLFCIELTLAVNTRD